MRTSVIVRWSLAFLIVIVSLALWAQRNEPAASYKIESCRPIGGGSLICKGGSL
jgi:hypothetical protein